MVDAQTLFHKYPNATNLHNPQALYGSTLAPYARMITRAENVIGSNAVDSLNVKAQITDLIRWRAVSLTDDQGYDVAFYQFVPGSGAGVISNPVRPNPASDMWEAEVKQKGVETYWWYFSITDPNNHTRYFYWDPTITVE
ncbi:inclusion body family protein [Chloroflexi bacterium TSY]|nr:inclusion body family protein [Chloroflexi bacterium TSY]